MNAKPKPFDTVSSATLRDSDLMVAMLDTLEYYRPKKYANLIKKGNAIITKYGDFGYIGHLPYVASSDEGIPSSDELDDIDWFIHEDLWDAVQSIAPAGTSFCSHPGDGALFGFWPDEDSDLWE